MKWDLSGNSEQFWYDAHVIVITWVSAGRIAVKSAQELELENSNREVVSLLTIGWLFFFLQIFDHLAIWAHQMLYMLSVVAVFMILRDFWHFLSPNSLQSKLKLSWDWNAQKDTVTDAHTFNDYLLSIVTAVIVTAVKR